VAKYGKETKEKNERNWKKSVRKDVKTNKANSEEAKKARRSFLDVEKVLSFIFVFFSLRDRTPKESTPEMPALEAETAEDDRPQGEQDDPSPSGDQARQESTRVAPANNSILPSTATERARALLACSASAWPLPLRRLSFATELLPLPEDVAAWMRSGGRVWLPEGSGAVRFFLV